MQRRVDREFACFCPCWILQFFFEWSTQGQEHLKVRSFRWQWKIRTFWTLCLFSVRENLGSPLPQVSVTRPWRERDGPCRMYAKLVGKYPIFVGPAWRERDGSVTGVWLEHWWQIYSFISISSGPNLFTCWLEYPLPAPFSDIFGQKWHNINLTLPEKEKYQHKIGRGWDEARSVL